MSQSDPLDLATQRLSRALEALETAMERRSEADRGTAALAEQVHALGTDRARLAAELDEVTARARTLETANRDVAGHIDGAIETIRGVLNSDE